MQNTVICLATHWQVHKYFQQCMTIFNLGLTNPKRILFLIKTIWHFIKLHKRHPGSASTTTISTVYAFLICSTYLFNTSAVLYSVALDRLIGGKINKLMETTTAIAPLLSLIESFE